MSFIKKHKIITGVLIFVLLLFLFCGWFILDKLNKISYHDGTISAEAQETAAEGSDQDGEEDQEDEEVLVDLEGLEDMETKLSDMEIFRDGDVFNILLLGTDERTRDFSENARADSIMILSLNKNEGTVKLVSLERGMGVPILEGQYEGSYDWLTHCFRYGGASLMLKEVQYCLRVDVDRYVRVNFNMFKQIVDSIGGVDISLTQREAEALGLAAGENHLNGESALGYARLRSIDSDWSRIVRQRNIIQAVIYQAKGLNLLEINEAADTILPLIQTNLTKTEILELIMFAPNILGKDMEQMSLPAQGTYGGMTGLQGRSLYAVDFETNAKILQEFLYGEITEDAS